VRTQIGQTDRQTDRQTDKLRHTESVTTGRITIHIRGWY